VTKLCTDQIDCFEIQLIYERLIPWKLNPTYIVGIHLLEENLITNVIIGPIQRQKKIFILLSFKLYFRRALVHWLISPVFLHIILVRRQFFSDVPFFRTHVNNSFSTSAIDKIFLRWSTRKSVTRHSRWLPRVQFQDFSVLLWSNQSRQKAF